MDLENVKAEALRWLTAAGQNQAAGEDKAAQYCLGASDALATLVEEECGDVLTVAHNWLTAEEYLQFSREDDA